MRWFRCYWDEEDVWFYFEVDAEGLVIRQVELQGPDGNAIAAADLDEWQRAQASERLSTYEATYGFTAALPTPEWGDHEPEWLTTEAFEHVWGQARRQIAARSGALSAGVEE